MNKKALQIGFEKAGRDLGLDNIQISNLWNQSLNYPEFHQMFSKMSDENLDMSPDTLDTLCNLEKISKLQKEFQCV